MAPREQWLSTVQAARRLGVTPRTVYGFIDRGVLPGYRIGRVIRIKVDDVTAFTESARIEPSTLTYLQRK